VIFVGYHARIGSQDAILEHTWSDERVANLWINGEATGEIGLNAGVCGHFGVPVILISGDQTACAEASALIEGIGTVVVKQASGRMAGRMPAACPGPRKDPGGSSQCSDAPEQRAGPQSL